MKTEEIIREYDPVIIKKLGAYLKPHKSKIILSLIFLVLAMIGELAVPLIIQKTVDNDIMPSWAISAEAPQGLPYEQIEGLYFTPSKGLKNKERSVYKNLQLTGFFREDQWLLFENTPQIKNLLTREKTDFLVSENTLALDRDTYSSLEGEIRQVLRNKDLKSIRNSALLLLILLITVVLFSFGQVFLMAVLSQDVMTSLRESLFAHVLRQSQSYLNRTPIGKLVSSVTSDVETINELFTSVFSSLLRDIILIIGAAVALMLLDVKLAWITLATLPPAFLLIGIFRVLSRKVYRKVQLQVSKVNTYLSEHLNGIQIVQLFGAEDKTHKEFEKENKGLFRAYMGQMYVHATFRPMIDFLSSVSLGVIVYFGSLFLHQGSLSLGILIAYINLLSKLYDPLKDISEKFSIMQSAMAGGERIFHLLEDRDYLTDRGEINTESIKGSLEFKQVRFSYKKEEEILKGIDFKVNPGETVAIVGYTGAGKSTIANLITRLWDIDSGEILLDGVLVQSYPLAKLRQWILPVAQDVTLFSGSLRDNLTMGRDISEEALQNALHTSRADEFIKALPDGLDTQLSESGQNLSSGERQLLSFARALTHDPQVLILDEATSHVDTQTEKWIQEALPALIEGRTSIVIAHRLSTIRHADRILVMQQGEIVETGSHLELIDMRGIYYNLYQLQFKDT